MKKFLLVMVAMFAALSVSAEPWTKSVSPVTDKADIFSNQTTIAADGSIFASTVYNTSFTFAEKAVADPAGMLSSCVLKYDKKGNEKWAASFVGGDVYIQSMTTDDDGNLYVAGYFSDAKMLCFGADQTTSVILEGILYTPVGFVAKISADGTISATKTITPSKPALVGYEDWIILSVLPSKIVVSGDKVYVSAKYAGEVTELGWQGSYVDYYYMAYADNWSHGIFSLSKADLGSPANVCTVQHTGRIIDALMDDVQNSADAFSFIVRDGEVYVAFIGWGPLTLSNGTASKDYTFEMAGNGINEHAFVGAAASSLGDFVLHATPSDVPYCNWKFFAQEENGVVYVGGSFMGSLFLDKDVTSPTEVPYFGAIDMKENKVKWYRFMADDNDLPVGAVKYGDSFTLATEKVGYISKAEDGTPGQDYVFGDKEVKALYQNDAASSIVYVTNDPTDLKFYIDGVEAPVVPADVTAAETWDWSNANGDGNELPTDLKNTDILLSKAPGFEPGTGFSADKLVINGQYAWRNANDSKFAQVNSIMFNTTVAGKVVVEYANTGNNPARTVVINGLADAGEATDNKNYLTSSAVAVEAGAVVIAGMDVSSSDAKMLRIRKVTFTPDGTGIQNINAAANVATGVKKYLKNGRLVIETARGTFSAAGAQLK